MPDQTPGAAPGAPPPLSPLQRAIAAIVTLIIAVAGVTIVVTSTDDGGGHKSTSVTIQSRNGPKVTAPVAEVQKVVHSGAEKDLGAEPGITPKILEKQDQAASPAAPRISGAVPLASAHQAGCLTRAIPANYSYRSGIRPSLVVLHYTVSPNRAGWSDVDSIVAFFSRSATQASSNYVIDAEGHCVLMIPESLKAWAQAGFNSATACSIEVVNTGSESSYIGARSGAGERQLARVVHDCAARWHIPLRRGATSGCGVTRSGVVDHFTLGSCGGGHHDVSPFRPGAIDAAIADAGGAGQPKPVTAHARKLCVELNTLRRRSRGYHAQHHLKPVPPLSAARAKRAAQLRHSLAKSYVCKVGAPGHRGTIRHK